MTVTIKGWKGDELVFSRPVSEAPPEDVATMLRDGLIDMTEIIFPDGEHFRFGSNPGRMVLPLEMLWK